MSRNGNYANSPAQQTYVPVPCIRMTYQTQVEETRPKPMIAFQADIAMGCAQKELDDLLDKCRNAVLRQKKLSEIEGCYIDIANFERQLVETQSQFSRMEEDFSKRKKEFEDKGGRGEFEFKSAQANEAQAAIVRLTSGISERRARLEQLAAGI